MVPLLSLVAPTSPVVAWLWCGVRCGVFVAAAAGDTEIDTGLASVARELRPVSALAANDDSRLFVLASVGGVDTDKVGRA